MGSTLSQENNSKILFRIFPDLVDRNRQNEYIYLTVTNFSNDTLITIKDVFIEGVTDSSSLYPMSIRYSPNVLFFASDSFPLAFIDGWFNVDFRRMPQFSIINPMSQIIFKVDISKYSELMSKHSWQPFGLISYTKKQILDSLILNHLTDYQDEYEKSIIKQDMVLIYGELTDSLNVYYANNSFNKHDDFNIIKTVFKDRIRSKNY